MRWLLVAGVSVGMACGSSGASTEAPDGGVGGASVDAALPADAGSLDGAPTDASADAALPPLGCLTLPTWQLPALKPSLPVTPKLLWRKRLMPNWGVTGFLVRSGNQLAFSARQLHVFDLSGEPLWSTNYPSFDIGVGSISADTDGNYYQFADKLYSYNSAGAVRYSIDFGHVGVGGDLFSYAPIVRGNDDLFFRSTEGQIRRLDARTGAVVWTREATPGSPGITAVAGLLRGDPGVVYEADGGKSFAVSSGGVPVTLLANVGRSLWLQRRDADGYHITASDSCWVPTRTPSPTAPVQGGCVDLDGRYWEPGPNERNTPLSLDGNDLAPLAFPRVQLVGADGTLFAIAYAGGTTVLTSYRAGLREDLSVPGTFANPTLGDDGIMHALSSESDGIYLVAIQTRSPGVGGSPLPMARLNNRRSAWRNEP